MKIIISGCLIAQMKRLDALVTNKKNPNSSNCTVAEKIRKKTPKTVIFEKNVIFWVFLFFKIFSVYFWQKVYRTTQSRASVGIVHPQLMLPHELAVCQLNTS